jgi:hypothetical protein
MRNVTQFWKTEAVERSRSGRMLKSDFWELLIGSEPVCCGTWESSEIRGTGAPKVGWGLQPNQDCSPARCPLVLQRLCSQEQTSSLGSRWPLAENSGPGKSRFCFFKSIYWIVKFSAPLPEPASQTPTENRLKYFFLGRKNWMALEKQPPDNKFGDSVEAKVNSPSDVNTGPSFYFLTHM